MMVADVIVLCARDDRELEQELERDRQTHKHKHKHTHTHTQREREREGEKTEREMLGGGVSTGEERIENIIIQNRVPVLKWNI